MTQATCTACGASIEPSDRFCGRCGAELGTVDDTGAIPAVTDSGPLPTVVEGRAPELPVGTAVLVVRRGPGEGARFLLAADTLVAGRSPEAEVFLDDVTVSRRHAVFTRSADGTDVSWSLSDEGSLNGTYVNRVLITGPVALRGGDEVQIGKYRFTFLEGAAA